MLLNRTDKRQTDLIGSRTDPKLYKEKNAMRTHADQIAWFNLSES